MLYDDYYRPSHDVVFALMFSNKALFIRLCSAVYDQPVMRENDVLLNAIRFDVLGGYESDIYIGYPNLFGMMGGNPMSQIKISKLTFAWPGSPDNVFEDVSLTLDTDWKLGLVGRNGRGKTTFLKLLTGGLKYQGSIQSAASFAYFLYEPPAASATRGAFRLMMPHAADWQLERELSLLDVKADVAERPLSTLSVIE
jgi:hypothetical protein